MSIEISPRARVRDMTIRSLVPSDEDQWRAMWSDYLAFYGASVDPALTDHVWRSIVSGKPSILGYCAVASGKLLGCAHVVPHPVTWASTDAAYLEDLFVDPEARKKGVGTALIEHVVSLAENNGWARVYWHTRADNLTARRVYNRFTSPDDVVRYTLRLA